MVNDGCVGTGVSMRGSDGLGGVDGALAVSERDHPPGMLFMVTTPDCTLAEHRGCV